jgi:hypothetical protein
MRDLYEFIWFSIYGVIWYVIIIGGLLILHVLIRS